MKPSNILINSDCEIKLCDFGLARVESVKDMTMYVTTRPYRAPELMFTSNIYDKAIDVWSIGLIFAELYTRKPLLMSKNMIDMMKKLFELIGKPDADVIDSMI